MSDDTPRLSDERHTTLLKRAPHDDEAFAELAQQYYGHILNWARTYLQSRSAMHLLRELEDIPQEVLRKCLSARRSTPPRLAHGIGSFLSYLRTATERLCKDIIQRTEMNPPAVLLDETIADPRSTPSSPTGRSGYTRLMMRELVEELAVACPPECFLILLIDGIHERNRRLICMLLRGSHLTLQDLADSLAKRLEEILTLDPGMGRVYIHPCYEKLGRDKGGMALGSKPVADLIRGDCVRWVGDQAGRRAKEFLRKHRAGKPSAFRPESDPEQATRSRRGAGKKRGAGRKSTQRPGNPPDERSDS